MSDQPIGDLSVSVRGQKVQPSVVQAIEGLQTVVARLLKSTAVVPTDPYTFELDAMVLIAGGNWATGLGDGDQFDGAGAPKGTASNATGAIYIGTSGNRVVYQINPAAVFDVGFGVPVAYVADAVVTEHGATGTPPGAGGFLASFDVATRVVASSPAYVAGASPNTANDALNRRIGQSALSLEFSIGVSDLAPNLTGLSAKTVAWQIFAIRGKQ